MGSDDTEAPPATARAMPRVWRGPCANCATSSRDLGIGWGRTCAAKTHQVEGQAPNHERSGARDPATFRTLGVAEDLHPMPPITMSNNKPRRPSGPSDAREVTE